MPTSFPTPVHLGIALASAAAIALAARAVKALSLSGAVAAAGTGFCLFGFGGEWGAAALLLFFVTSSALSRVGKRRKESLEFEKGGERDAGQVLANGGVAAVCAILIPFFPGAGWPVAATLGALAAANADTWATELGALAKGEPRMITTGRPAPTGSSGAISVPGTLAALAGAALLGAVALFWRSDEMSFPLGIRGLVAITLGGLCGSLFDSLLGATVQVQYRRPDGKLTERTEYNGQPAEYAHGLRGMNNDAVNALATLCGAVVATAVSAIAR